ncbi:hypothetical protein [Dongshaea marina]|uniref:hypothetical protein n=1 Tax=Dongshaea marina TaxID=2047966 RepID=UPI00131F45A0|nr:hypothetical protein [Dongshaea marina]
MDNETLQQLLKSAKEDLGRSKNTTRDRAEQQESQSEHCESKQDARVDELEVSHE